MFGFWILVFRCAPTLASARNVWHVGVVSTLTFSEAEGLDLQQFARDKAMEWSGLCRRFLDVTRQEILLGNPTPETLDAHRNATKWLLRMTRALHLAAADPDFPDRRVADELEGRVIQLEHAWSQIHDPMPEAEADKLLAEIFPQ